jgi:hypothetical protein
MTVEADIFTALKGLVGNRAYPDIAPANAAKPYITYQQVGGAAVNLLANAPAGKRNGRFQVNVWASTRAEASNLARQVEDALVADDALKAFVVGAPISIYEEEVLLYGTHQDFSIWY